MASVTVKQLAEVVGIPVETLLTQMKEAGLSHSAIDSEVSDDEKQQLLSHLKRAHGNTESEPKKITLKRKTTSTLKTTGASGRAKNVAVEVRKKRTYVKRSVVEDEQREAEEKAKVEAEEAARVEAEAKEVQDAKDREEAQVRRDAEIQAEAAQKKAGTATEKKAKSIVTHKAVENNAAKEKATKLEAEERARQAEKTTKKDGAAVKEAEAKAAKETAEQAAKLAEELAQRTTEDKQEPEEEVVDTLVKQAVEESFEREHKSIKKDVTTRRRKKKQQQQERLVERTLKKSSILGSHGFKKPTKETTMEIEIGETITVQELASRLAIKGTQLVKMLIKMGEMVSLTQAIDHETATLVVEEMGHSTKLVKHDAIEDELKGAIQRDDNATHRAPVVTIMGHVDHGKTSLLDYIRRAKVADGEAGGITQHIGAYHVETDKGMISFLDTPGHAAFTAMRARGAKATDIVVIVVAADDGVMPQTEEAISHAKASGVPLIIAVNKIDKEGADLERVKSELAAKEVIPEDWGGEYQFIPVSAHTGEGVDNLLEAILLQAELLELTAQVDGHAEGTVIEARLDKGRGVVASILVQAGTLKRGDMVLAGKYFGRVRALVDENGKPIKSAGPSIPVEVLGLAGVPDAGDQFMAVEDERKAKEVAEFRAERERQDRMQRQQSSKLENLFENLGAQERPAVNVVLKTDVRGSLEALISSLNDLSTDEVQVRIVSANVGGITESDVNLAMTSGGVILGFNVRADSSAKRLCQDEGIDLRYYSIIYEMIDDVKAAMSGLLSPERREEILGVAEVRDVFRSSKFGAVAGSMVVEGTLYRNRPIRVLRDDIVVFEGELESLRRFKDDVAEVRNGTECGIAVKSYNDVKAGDKIEVFEVKEFARTL